MKSQQWILQALQALQELTVLEAPQREALVEVVMALQVVQEASIASHLPTSSANPQSLQSKDYLQLWAAAGQKEALTPWQPMVAWVGAELQTTQGLLLAQVQVLYLLQVASYWFSTDWPRLLQIYQVRLPTSQRLP